MRSFSRDHSSWHGRRSGAVRRARSLALLAVLMFTTAFVGGPTAAAAPPGECPDILPTADLKIGSLGRGWTVPVGDDPQPFRVEYLGVLEDGIAPGHDLIVIWVSDLPGRDFMTKAGGIWAGISGSPVYSNGDLVGAVAYSFGAGDAFVGGVTPAEEMARVLDYPDTAAAEPAGCDRIALTPQLRAQLERVGVDTVDSESFERLPIPLAVSGLNQRARDRFQAYWTSRASRSSSRPARGRRPRRTAASVPHAPAATSRRSSRSATSRPVASAPRRTSVAHRRWRSAIR